MSPFVRCGGQVYLVMNWDYDLEPDCILLLRPLTRKEVALYEKSILECEREIWARMVVKARDRLSTGY
jgi:hypothetical protein